MKQTYTAVVAVALGLGLSACSSLKVQSTFDPKADFSSLRTYAWAAGPGQGSVADLVRDPAVNERIHAVVDERLAAADYQLVDPKEADFLVSARVAVQDKVELGTGRGEEDAGPVAGVRFTPDDKQWKWRDALEQEVLREYEVGTLVVDIADPETHRLIWRGSAEAELGGSKPTDEQRLTRVDEAVVAILRRFPPPSF